MNFTRQHLDETKRIIDALDVGVGDLDRQLVGTIDQILVVAHVEALGEPDDGCLIHELGDDDAHG